MLALLQRVSHASVVIEDITTASINKGILVLCGFQPHDKLQSLDKMLEKCLNYRIFSDNDGKMNLSVKAIEGELLFVPQFTLAANTNSGLRPSFSSAAIPQHGQELFDELKRLAPEKYSACSFGQFGANMQVSLCNDGPVTFWLSN